MERILAVGGFTEADIEAMSRDRECANIIDPNEAIEYFRTRHGEIVAVVMSLRMKQMDGRDAMEEIHRVEPDMPVIISTHTTEVPEVVNAMERGAFSYIYEPNLGQELPILLRRAATHIEAVRENRRLQAIIGEKETLSRFVGISASVQTVLETIRKVADSNIPVLFIGESGTGKEIAARILHDLSPRRDAPFVAVNCGALSPTLLESELFGYRKGAFTGAAEDRPGLFEQARKGTLFLDELGATDTSFQVKLLRVLESGELRRVGDDKTRRTDARIVTATNAPLDEAIEKGRFREDLYYRLSVVPIEIAPLRDRREDIPVLAHYFLEELRGKYPAAPTRISPPALRSLRSYDWPGNVRELRNVMEHAVLLGGREAIRPGNLPEKVASAARETGAVDGASLDDAVGALEKRLISDALKRAGNNKAQAARMLKIKRTTLLAKMTRLGL
jgi:DNA-binding NtrC family response regulator